MAQVEVKVPDIGDFEEIAVIELLVKPGDTIKAEQSLVTVESDKASMEIPSSHAGVLKELKVKIGDKVAEGSVIAVPSGSRLRGRPLRGSGPAAAPRANRRRAGGSRPASPAAAASKCASRHR